MIGKKRKHIAAVSEDILGKSLQRFLRSNFHKDPRASVVERAQSLDELHGGSDLFGQEIQHLRDNVRPGGIELAIYVGNDGQVRGFQVKKREILSQWFTGRRATGA